VIRAVLDSNVIISGLGTVPARKSVLSQVIDRWRRDDFIVIASDEIEREVATAWKRPYWVNRHPAGFAELTIEFLRQRSFYVSLANQLVGAAPHRHDDHVLQAALAGRCDFIVTGDLELQQMSAFQGIRIVSPDAFLRVLNDAEQDAR